MKIVIIQTAFLGDVILTTPLFRALWQKYPHAHITIITTPESAELLCEIQKVSCVTLDKKRDGFFEGISKVLKELKSVEFDELYCVHRSFRSAFLAWRILAKQKISFKNIWSKLFGFISVDYPKYNDQTHYVDRVFKLLQSNILLDRTPYLNLKSEVEKNFSVHFSELLQATNQKYIVVSPFSNWATKMWFSDRFVKLAIRLSEKTKKTIVLVGPPGNREWLISDTMAQKISSAGCQVFNLVGKTKVSELAMVIQKSSLLISNDSAPVHIAAAYQVPTVAVFGPTVKKLGFFPLSSRSTIVEVNNLSCRPCGLHGHDRCPKKHFKCMNDISVDMAYQAVERVLI